MTPIDVATRTALPQIVAGHHTFGVVVTDDGTTAFVTSAGVPDVANDGMVVPIDVATNAPGTPIAVGGELGAVAIRPPAQPDTTPPSLVLQTTPAAPTGGGGTWFNRQDLPGGSLTVFANALDEESGVASVTCVVDGQSRSASGDRLVVQGLGDGVHALSCTATDNAGNVTDPAVTATYRVDTVAPALAPTVAGSGPAGAALLDDNAAVAAPNASDGGIGSGVATSSCGTPDVSSVGPHTVSCSATDAAGNTATTQAAYVVEYRLVGLSPADGTSARAGRPLQIRVSLADASGTLVSPCNGCVVSFQAFAVGGAGENAGPFEMRYHAASEQLRFSWKPAASGTGQTSFTVAVRYPDTTETTMVSALITLT